MHDEFFEAFRKLESGEHGFFDMPIAEFVRQIAKLDVAGVRGRKIATMSQGGVHALKAAVCASSGTVFRYVSELSMDPPGHNYVGELFGVAIVEVDSQAAPLTMSAIP